MSKNVVIVVDLDATAAPPASDSVRQLLALIDGLNTENGDLDWRLMSLSLNSPLRAELRAFTPDGEEVSDARIVDAANRGFEVLAAINDNLSSVRGPLTNDNLSSSALGPLITMDAPDRSRLKAFLQPLKGRTGRVSVSVPGRFDYSVTSASAETALEQIGGLERRATPPAPELGAVEGRIREVTTYYGRPAIRLARDLTDETVLCVFNAAAIQELGAEHTLAEVWGGRRVEVSGKLFFSPEARLMRVDATSMRGLTESVDILYLLREARERGEVAADLISWADDD